MLKQRATLFAFLFYAFDMFIALGSFFIAYWIRDALVTKFPAKIYYFSRLYPLSRYVWLLLLIIPLWSCLFIIFKLYHSQRIKSLASEIFSIFKALFVGNLVIWAFLFSLKYYYISRPFIFIFGIVNFLFMAIERVIIRLTLRSIRRKGYNQKLILIVGTNKSAINLAKLIQRNKDWGFQLLGFVSYSDKIKKDTLEGYPVLGSVNDFAQLIDKTVVDEVIFTISKSNFKAVNDLLLMCEEVGIKARVEVDFFPQVSSKIHLEELQDVPLLTFSNTPSNIFSLSVKRFLDLIISLCSVVILSPLFLLIAILIKATSKGPILYKQIRSGLNGRRFTCYKFRSMVVGADNKINEIEHLNIMTGPVFKVKNDPRLTKIGKILRKYSLDELPQLWNVVKGEMSLVGPRPPIPQEVHKYQKWQRRRLSMKPGITCLWQVSGRNRVDFDTWMKLDLQYIDNWSLGLDFKILLKTIPVVIFSKGAM